MMKDKWISVKDRLPEDETSVLTYSIHGILEVLFYYRDQLYDEGYPTSIFEEGWIDKNDDAVDIMEITHWMPLPEKPDER